MYITDLDSHINRYLFFGLRMIPVAKKIFTYILIIYNLQLHINAVYHKANQGIFEGNVITIYLFIICNRIIYILRQRSNMFKLRFDIF